MSRRCKHLCEIDVDRDEPLRYCRLVVNKKCEENFLDLPLLRRSDSNVLGSPLIIYCEDYEPKKKKRKWVPQFITEEEMTL